jgi:RHS repeat-associated protein
VTRVFVYGTRANVPDYMIEGSNNYRFVTDPRGSVRAVLDESGAIVQRMDYDAFGFILDEDVASGFTPVPFGFAGGIHDPLTGLVRFGARDYDPITGRWTAKDPASFEGGLNLYEYAYGDPVNYVDSNGEWAWIVAGGVIGGGLSVVSQLAADNGDSSAGALISAFWWGAVAGAFGAAVGAPSLGLGIGSQVALNGIMGAITNAAHTAIVNSGRGQCTITPEGGSSATSGLASSFLYGAIGGAAGTGIGGLVARGVTGYGGRLAAEGATRTGAGAGGWSASSRAAGQRLAGWGRFLVRVAPHAGNNIGSGVSTFGANAPGMARFPR